MELRVLVLYLLVSAVGGENGDSTYPAIPLLFAEGTHYSIGKQIGAASRSQIRTVMQSSSFFNDKMLPFNQTAEGSNLYSLFLATATRIYPQYVSELHGMADGAEIPFSELFLWNLRSEWSVIIGGKTQLLPSACSDLFLANGKNTTLIGHNEDYGPIDINTNLMVHARINDPDFGTTDEFLAFCYAGTLCGSAFGINFHTKTAISRNALFPLTVNKNGIARNFLMRATTSLSLDELRSTLRSVSCASGFSVTVAPFGGMEMSNFEIAPSGATEKSISGYDYHFNMYLHSPGVSQYNDTSSVHRLERVKELPTPTDSADILKILGDTGDKQYPLYRTGKPPDGAATLATGLFDISRGIFSVYRGNPGEVEPTMVVYMPL